VNAEARLIVVEGAAARALHHAASALPAPAIPLLSSRVDGACTRSARARRDHAIEPQTITQAFLAFVPKSSQARRRWDNELRLSPHSARAFFAVAKNARTLCRASLPRNARNEPNLRCNTGVSAGPAPFRARWRRARDGEPRRLRRTLFAGSSARGCSPTRHAGRERPAALDADPGGAIGRLLPWTDSSKVGVASPRATWTATRREDTLLGTPRVRDTSGLARCLRVASAPVSTLAREASALGARAARVGEDDFACARGFALGANGLVVRNSTLVRGLVARAARAEMGRRRKRIILIVWNRMRHSIRTDTDLARRHTSLTGARTSLKQAKKCTQKLTAARKRWCRVSLGSHELAGLAWCSRPIPRVLASRPATFRAPLP
jgi:hypothetical protein